MRVSFHSVSHLFSVTALGTPASETTSSKWLLWGTSWNTHVPPSSCGCTLCRETWRVTASVELMKPCVQMGRCQEHLPGLSTLVYLQLRPMEPRSATESTLAQREKPSRGSTSVPPQLPPASLWPSVLTDSQKQLPSCPPRNEPAGSPTGTVQPQHHTQHICLHDSPGVSFQEHTTGGLASGPRPATSLAFNPSKRENAEACCPAGRRWPVAAGRRGGLLHKAATEALSGLHGCRLQVWKCHSKDAGLDRACPWSPCPAAGRLQSWRGLVCPRRFDPGLLDPGALFTLSVRVP